MCTRDFAREFIHSCHDLVKSIYIYFSREGVVYGDSLMSHQNSMLSFERTFPRCYFCECIQCCLTFWKLLFKVTRFRWPRYAVCTINVKFSAIFKLRYDLHMKFRIPCPLTLSCLKKINRSISLSRNKK